MVSSILPSSLFELPFYSGLQGWRDAVQIPVKGHGFNTLNLNPSFSGCNVRVSSAEIRADVFGVRVGGAIVWSNLLLIAPKKQGPGSF